ncbi:hypothetical protein GCM10018785_52950 [Streptomyces longispororuber]|uniref:Uncharacterized protein n=1 Tax=Streptomyces longispororuber TaxID=68230 RepID=A0A919A030_9ACTN|nr:hypothetical protein GCM10018785_52950 [Streptomyces longispororuber]
MLIAVAGVAGTLGGALLTQRGSERAKRLEMKLLQDHEEVRENRSLRRTCYVELNRDARQFTTALNRQALNTVYGQVKRLERGAPEPGETRETAAQAQYEIWEMLRTMRTAMRRDLGVSHGD